MMRLLRCPAGLVVACCVVLGHTADNTVGNAREIHFALLEISVHEVGRFADDHAFTGEHLAQLPSEVLLKEILRPSLADTFWGAAAKVQRELTLALHKAVLRQKIANPPKRHRWTQTLAPHF